MHEFFVGFVIGLVAKGEVQPVFLVDYGLRVGEGLKSRPSMVGAHAALAHAAKTHFAGGEVYDDVVDAAAAVA